MQIIYIQRVWSVKTNARDSWNWNSLLSLRPLAERFITCTVGSGKEASFWFDNWTPLGPLIKHIGDHGPRDCRIPLDARVADACDHSGWKLPAPRSDAVLNLHIYLISISLPSRSQSEDCYHWFVDGTKLQSFSSPHTWNALR